MRPPPASRANLQPTIRKSLPGSNERSPSSPSTQSKKAGTRKNIPVCRGGRSDLGNLALACPGCNLHKGSRITAFDPVTGQSVQLFHPIVQEWSDHFRLHGYQIEGLNAVGRATIEALNLNHSRRQRIREIEEAFGLFPPAK